MKLQSALIGVLLCLGTLVQAQTSDQQNTSKKSTQSANRMKRATPSVVKGITGCVDQQNGHYVLRDEQTSQILDLQASGQDADSWFARFVGHKVEASGSKESDSTMHVSQIHQVADMCGTGK